ncbi:DUF4357 domain-containing protein [Candidatus Saccharibacteria bacterium]|nr:DUF4357 domain-containing protein [Candidatus Saccharibacteria bacterium]MBR1875153.1 DUF4357 domain-containing protein [Candidatus Saccharibacteria bacterium]
MKPDATSILSFINSADKTFVIPVYQRNYSWRAEECEKLFEDLLESLKTNKRHYFGNIVYYVLDSVIWQGYSELALIDGQQRVTTIMLLLAAIRDTELDETKRKTITETYLLNRNSTTKERVKLKQIESDRDIYESIINGTFDESSDSNAGRNYKVFKRLIKNSGISTDDLLKAINNLEVVALDLNLNENKERSESPQIIFESINATGKSLSTADLLRNYLLMGIEDSKQESYYKDYWLVVEKGIGNDNISDFINKYLIMKIGDSVNKNTEYAEFKKYLTKNHVTVIEALKDLAHYSKYYAWIQQPDTSKSLDAKTAERLTDLKELKTSSMAPLLLFLLEKADDNNVPSFGASELNNALVALESWGFRARITGVLTSGAFNTISSTSLLNVLKKSDKTNYDEQLIFELSNYRTQDIWPTDQEFMSAFKKYNFYKTYKDYVQRKLENHISNDHHNWKPDSIEHIMPETLSADWKRRLGDNYAEIHGEYLHTIGNLSPLNMKDNIINSNDPFTIKLPQYKASSWKLTRDIYDNYSNVENWGVNEISNRADSLAYEAVKIWSGPDNRVRQIEASTKEKDNDYRRIIPGGRTCDTVFHLIWKNYKMNNGFEFNIDAKMRIEFINEKPHFIVMAGSKIFPYIDGGKTLNKREQEIRKVGWNDDVILRQDINIFTSPSGASDFVTSYSTNGWTEWKTSDGETLDDIVASDIEKSYENLSD